MRHRERVRNGRQVTFRRKDNKIFYNGMQGSKNGSTLIPKEEKQKQVYIWLEKNPTILKFPMKEISINNKKLVSYRTYSLIIMQ